MLVPEGICDYFTSGSDEVATTHGDIGHLVEFDSLAVGIDAIHFRVIATTKVATHKALGGTSALKGKRETSINSHAESASTKLVAVGTNGLSAVGFVICHGMLLWNNYHFVSIFLDYAFYWQTHPGLLVYSLRTTRKLLRSSMFSPWDCDHSAESVERQFHHTTGILVVDVSLGGGLFVV